MGVCSCSPKPNQPPNSVRHTRRLIFKNPALPCEPLPRPHHSHNHGDLVRVVVAINLSLFWVLNPGSVFMVSQVGHQIYRLIPFCIWEEGKHHGGIGSLGIARLLLSRSRYLHTGFILATLKVFLHWYFGA